MKVFDFKFKMLIISKLNMHWYVEHYQVYLLLSCIPCEGRISGIVDAPNAVATLAIPTAIFDQVNMMIKQKLKPL